MESLHHKQLMDGFFQSHVIRNHSAATIKNNMRFLESWFQTYGSENRPLWSWEAMRPVEGRKRIVEYGKALIQVELANQTIRSYLGTLRSYFEYVLEHPFVFDKSGSPHRLIAYYGPIEQPISEYDIPQHSYDGSDKRLGVPLDPAHLHEFYSILRKHYLLGSHAHVRARNYTMVVLAGESGLRANELRNLETEKDLFFDSKKIQTRSAKGTNGSGKRSRLTLFTPLARDTSRFYLKTHRPQLVGIGQNSYLFPAQYGGGPISYPQMAQFLAEMVDLANRKGLFIADHFSWHWMRRIFATRFIETFPNELPTLIALMGHSSFGTIHKYIQHSLAWMDRHIQGVVERVEHDGY
jgi:site-specific recombinase XerD